MTALRNEEVYLTPEEYLAFEESSPLKHEYANGYVRAMAGGSRMHGRIAKNILLSLDQQLDGTRCEPVGSELRLPIGCGPDSFYYYPDVTVDCSGKDTDVLEEPTVIFEVLSASTDGYDRGEK